MWLLLNLNNHIVGTAKKEDNYVITMPEKWSKHFIVLNFQFDSCRHLLVDPLFKLLSKVFSEEWVNGTIFLEKVSNQPSPSPSEANNTINHIQQTLLIILEDIIMSLQSMASLNVCFHFPKREAGIFIIINSLLSFLLVPFIKFHHC